jgi:hypothetical protein
MIGMSLALFTQKHGLTLEHDVDDFDEFRALYLDVDGHPAMLKRYNGERSEGITIYLEAGLNEKSAARLLSKILRKYEINRADLVWRETMPVPQKARSVAH